ncbi:secondary thiamine-phosphate synthase enzyme YjbQ [Aestuariibaculum lutulentum]|uniref:Secondary thiamine-phosphate synthase enzyme YjbQ n=1 Tax=Aestuariibaculum lutulentum TaxID=2920935 RepID=A0ABS9RDG6_9FLAO|nr:secondary thiamine-phosphate synthase enzyme YjbQ [Aestuariibaculum lutulentum]MCH4550997.1 secondary thiamine-phosphate synthase enzyme YjbQ [Aestuariibaculum lutulentum]
MKVFQKEIRLKSYPRGFHLITDTVLDAIPEINEIKGGQLQVFIKHTSASLTINENADYTVRGDFERHFNVMVPENAPYYKHTYEGADDMPAHIKASLLGASVQIPLTNGKLNLGIWQGIYLCEHRDYGGERRLVITAFGI